MADLHVHSCLSPCAELDMTPKRIMEAAAKKDIEVIAITDHNSAENIGAALEAAAKAGITVLPAMEITSSEEAHVLALFGSLAAALSMQAIVYENLDGVNNERLWGSQVVVNEADEVMGFNDRLLIGATGLPVKRLVEEIHALGGLAVASHVDREAFSLISQLGFIPDDLGIDAIEVTRVDAAVEGGGHLPRLCNSDAHRLEDIGRRTMVLCMEEPTFDEIKLALRGMEGRRLKCR